MNNRYILTFIAVFFSLAGVAKVSHPFSNKIIESADDIADTDTLSSVLQDYLFLQLNLEGDKPKMDTISFLYNKYIGELDYLNDESAPVRYIASDPNYYRLFMPLTYYNSPMERLSRVDYKIDLPDKRKEYSAKLLPVDTVRFSSLDRANAIVDQALLSVYATYPQYIVTSEDKINGLEVHYATAKDQQPKSSVLDLFTPEPIKADVGKADLVIRKPNWWVTGGSGSLQITQNYISSNWHKGGESTNAMMAQLILFANYNDREKLQFENKFEGKMGFNTVASDTVRKYRINTDILRLSSKLGIQASKHWYYTLSAEFNTQFAKNYKKNTDEVVSAFLAPANLAVSLGMDYKLRRKKINLSVIVSPAAYNVRYVRGDEVDETKFGLEKGKSFLHDVGSKLLSNMDWKISPVMTWTSRLYYFTNYEKVEAEWENTFNFTLNRYLSTKLFVHSRFDDGAKRLDGKSYFQLKELLSFGLNYTW